MNTLSMPFTTSQEVAMVAVFISSLQVEGVRFTAKQDFDTMVFTFTR